MDTETILQKFFSFEGAIGRLTFLCRLLVVVVLSVLVTYLLEDKGSPYSTIYYVLGVLSLWANLALISKRLRDIGKSLWLIILHFIPLVNFFFLLYLLFKKGK